MNNNKTSQSKMLDRGATRWMFHARRSGKRAPLIITLDKLLENVDIPDWC